MINKIIFTLSFFLLVSAAKAQNEIGVSLRDFSGGVNNNAATIALKANESPDAKNIVIDEPWGQAKTRNGSLTCGSIPSGNTITNTYEYIRANGTHELILTDNTNIYTTIDCVNVSTIVAGLSEVANPYFDTFFDKLWITNKSTHVYTWDGTTLTMLDGTGTKPNPPLGQYITHWKERVWLARTPTEPSAVYFTDLTDEISGSNVDPSISTSAWNTLNAIYIAQEDGSPIYGIKVYRDSLFVFKETGIWRILFETAYNINVVKSVSNVGCRFQDSIVELDNFLYFVGPDGIYKFDGNDAVRISDNIQQYFNALKQPMARDAFQLWETASDFVGGTLVNTSTYPYPNSVSLGISTYTAASFEDFSDGDYTNSPTWTVGYTDSQGTLSITGNKMRLTGPGGINNGVRRIYTDYPSNRGVYGAWEIKYKTSSTTNNNGYYWFQSNCQITSLSGCKNAYGLRIDGGLGSGFGVYLIDGDGSSLAPFGFITASTNEIKFKIIRDTNDVFWAYADDVLISSKTASAHTFTISSAAYVVVGLDAFGSTYVELDDIKVLGFKDSGTYSSAISTYSALSAWRTFDVDEILNGQTINYYVRTATSAYNVLTSTWTSINSGNVISTTTNKYFQWKADLATSDTSKTPLIDAVTANYREGDATATRLQMINYKNRLYLTGSTTPANNFNDFVMVKTKSPLDNWIPYDWNISAFTKWNNYLYGGISETANVARFDYGTNDNGRAINAYWTWGDQHWDRMSYKKNLKEIYAFYLPTQSSANTYIGYSIDGGTTWTDRTINMTGTSAFGTKKMNNVGGIGNAIRMRVGNNSLDQSFNILGLDLWALPYVNRE